MSNQGSGQNRISIITLPLKYEQWQKDILDKRFDLCRRIYNAMLKYEVGEYARMMKDPRWVSSASVIKEAYRTDKVTPDDKRAALDIRNNLYKEYGFTEFAFKNAVKTFYKDNKDFSANIPSSVAGLSIAKPLWAAFKAKMYKGAEFISDKPKGGLRSIASDGRSGLRLTDSTKKTVLKRTEDEPLYVSYGTTKGKVLHIPVAIRSDDAYAKEALANPVKIVRLLRKPKGQDCQYCVQITVAGAPPIKHDSTGAELYPAGKGRVELKIKDSLIMADGEHKKARLCSDKAPYSHTEEISNIKRYMAASKRILNPDNYNGDGTIKSSRTVNGKSRRLKWNYSKGYLRAKAKQNGLYRIDKESRQMSNNRFANRLLSLGNEFYLIKDDSKEPGNSRAIIKRLDEKLKERGYKGVVTTISKEE